MDCTQQLPAVIMGAISCFRVWRLLHPALQHVLLSCSLIYRHRWHFPRTCVWEWYLHYHVHYNWYIHSESVNHNIHNECKCMCDIQYCWLVLLSVCVCFTFAHSVRYVYYNILENIMQESQYTMHCIYLTWYQVRDYCNYKIISFTKMSCRVYFTCSSGEYSFQ